MGILTVFGGDKLLQFAFNLRYILAWGEPGPVGNAENMGIDGDGGVTKGGVKNNIGGLAADTWQLFQGFSGFWYLAGVLCKQQAAGFDDVLGLGVVKANGLDVVLQPIKSQCQYFFRGIGLGIKPGSSLVDANIGGLGGQDD